MDTRASIGLLLLSSGLASGCQDSGPDPSERGTPGIRLTSVTFRVYREGRLAAAGQAARSLPFPFVLTARCENFLHGKADLDDTIRRLQAYEKVGADVLFAPGLPDLAAVEAVCSAVSRPVNFMAGIPGRSFSVAELDLCRSPRGCHLPAGAHPGADGEDMIEKTKTYKILEGYRGGPAYDIESIAECLKKLSQLVTDFEEIKELDINPLLVYEKGKGCTVVDARIILG